MKCIFYNSRFAKSLLKKDFSAVMICGFVFFKEASVERSEIEHERIHQQQYLSFVWVGLFLVSIVVLFLLAVGIKNWWMLLFALFPFLLFYLYYIVEYLFRLAKYNDKFKAYRMISLEQEAYDLQNEYKKTFLQKRRWKPFSFLKYIIR